MTDAIRPHPFAIPDADLDDLRQRLARTRWPDRETVDDWSQGVPLAKLQALSEYWRERHDWRATEARLNALEPSSTTIDGLDIHFLHIRSPEPDALPLVITHGWSGSSIENAKAAQLLADPRAHGRDPGDAFHVVLPSMPGFGLSGKPTAPGWTPERIARAWVELMRRLGYDSFVAQGGDWGYSITNELGGIGAPSVRAVHFNMFPVFEGMEAQDAQEEEGLRRIRDFAANQSGYQLMQIQTPQTIAYALADSPVGQAAWLLDLYWRWMDHDGDPTQAASIDDILDTISWYWLTGTAASSARIYWESMRSFKERKIDVPVAFSQFPRDLHMASRRWVQERYPTLVYHHAVARGGHYPAMEQPELFADELRKGFRSVR